MTNYLIQMTAKLNAFLGQINTLDYLSGYGQRNTFIRSRGDTASNELYVSPRLNYLLCPIYLISKKTSATRMTSSFDILTLRTQK